VISIYGVSDDAQNTGNIQEGKKARTAEKRKAAKSQRKLAHLGNFGWEKQCEGTGVEARPEGSIDTEMKSRGQGVNLMADKRKSKWTEGYKDRPAKR